MGEAKKPGASVRGWVAAVGRAPEGKAQATTGKDCIGIEALARSETADGEAQSSSSQ